MDGYRVFTWDKERFPDPKKLVADLAADGFGRLRIVDPGVKLDGRYAVFREGIVTVISSAIPTGNCSSAQCGRDARCFRTLCGPKPAAGGASCTVSLLHDDRHRRHLE